MKRTDFLKTLGALIIAPLAINSILKDNGCLYNREAVKAEMELDVKRDKEVLRQRHSSMIGCVCKCKNTKGAFLVTHISNNFIKLINLDSQASPQQLTLNINRRNNELFIIYRAFG